MYNIIRAVDLLLLYNVCTPQTQDSLVAGTLSSLHHLTIDSLKQIMVKEKHVCVYECVHVRLSTGQNTSPYAHVLLSLNSEAAAADAVAAMA